MQPRDCSQIAFLKKNYFFFYLFTVTFITRATAPEVSFGGVLHASLDVRRTAAHDGVVGTWCLYRHASQLQWAAHPGLHPAPKTCSV